MGQKNHVVPPSWQDEALARDGVSREVPCSALKGETVPDGCKGREGPTVTDLAESPGQVGDQ